MVRCCEEGESNKKGFRMSSGVLQVEKDQSKKSHIFHGNLRTMISRMDVFSLYPSYVCCVSNFLSRDFQALGPLENYVDKDPKGSHRVHFWGLMEFNKK